MWGKYYNIIYKSRFEIIRKIYSWFLISWHISNKIVSAIQIHLLVQWSLGENAAMFYYEPRQIHYKMYLVEHKRQEHSRKS